MAGFKITHSVDVYRLTRSGNNEEYPSTPEYQKVECGIFPASTDILATFPGESSFQLYEIYIQETGVALKNGDKLKAGTNDWIVRGVPQIYDLNMMYYTRVVGEKVV